VSFVVLRLIGSQQLTRSMVQCPALPWMEGGWRLLVSCCDVTPSLEKGACVSQCTRDGNEVTNVASRLSVRYKLRNLFLRIQIFAALKNPDLFHAQMFNFTLNATPGGPIYMLRPALVSGEHIIVNGLIYSFINAGQRKFNFNFTIKY